MGKRYIKNRLDKYLTTGDPNSAKYVKLESCGIGFSQCFKPFNSLILLDITNTYITPEVRNLAKEQVELGKRKNFKVTILGVSFIKRVITSALNKYLYFAKNKTDALDWLVKQK